ncbi:MAG: acyl transferase [Bacteroidetes bacterium GWF2_33_16]|nr:MAG: acyl transferase [Bacteroidetes bacterium GWE2_32_14]OFY03503.1 MAG: acyl transferase [Bacteroidetes bacterium GWF2_33_16]
MFDIFSIKSAEEFEVIAIKTFHYQAENNAIYKEYLQLLKIESSEIKSIHDIPFLPIDFFKSHKIICGTSNHEKVFFSSGTTGSVRSNHFISDLSVYETSFKKGFTHFYGSITDYCILALLPTYLENESSSLVYMTDHLIRLSQHTESGFYLKNTQELIQKLSYLEKIKQKTILLGVSYALLDLAENYPIKLDHTIVMETGGMKGKRKELTRQELHSVLTKGFGVESIHSEYGMTELLSQAYSSGNGKFYCPPWMKIFIRDMYDPFSFLENGKSGGINIIDLANINSCAFIETKDLGKINSDGRFEVSGRFDASDIRGCNLLVAE